MGAATESYVLEDETCCWWWERGGCCSILVSVLFRLLARCRVCDLPTGMAAFDRSQIGIAAMFLLCCTLVANRLKYSDTEFAPPGVTASLLSVGYVGAPSTEAPRAERSNIEACILAVVCLCEAEDEVDERLALGRW